MIAHEVGHHVQNLLGISDQVHSQRSRMSERDANALSVLTELQADCFAGIWAHHAQKQRKVLEEGDVDQRMSFAVGGLVLAALLTMLLILIAIGGGREHT